MLFSSVIAIFIIGTTFLFFKNLRKVYSTKRIMGVKGNQTIYISLSGGSVTFIGGLNGLVIFISNRIYKKIVHLFV